MIFRDLNIGKLCSNEGIGVFKLQIFKIKYMKGYDGGIRYLINLLS